MEKLPNLADMPSRDPATGRVSSDEDLHKRREQTTAFAGKNPVRVTEDDIDAGIEALRAQAPPGVGADINASSSGYSADDNDSENNVVCTIGQPTWYLNPAHWDR